MRAAAEGWPPARGSPLVPAERLIPWSEPQKVGTTPQTQPTKEALRGTSMPVSINFGASHIDIILSLCFAMD